MKKNSFEKPELSASDLTKSLYEVSQKLNKANQQLKAEEMERKEFYANISHDLRAPLSAISNSIEYLQTASEISKEDLDSTLTLMAKRTDYLKNLVNDIFLLSSLETSTEKVHKEAVNVTFFLEDFFYGCLADPEFESCDLNLRIDPKLEALDLTLELDPTLMQRALMNLFVNSKKYSQGTPYITLGEFLVSPGYLGIYVSDKGIGIPADAKDKIFNRSFRVDHSRTPGDDTSSGFGLAIVKEIVERHNGYLTCESTEGVGTTFIAVFQYE